MKKIVNVLVAAGAGGRASLGARAGAAPAIAVTHHAAACSTNWGTNAKHRGSAAITVATRLQAVRAGRHGCFDRLVIDLSAGKQPPFSAQYVKNIVAHGSGKALKVRGKAEIPIVLRGPAGRGYHANAVNLTNVSGFKTFRQGRAAGSLAPATATGLAGRGKLPFRAVELRP